MRVFIKILCAILSLVFSTTDQALAELEDAIIDVLLKNAHENGRDAYMSAPNIGRKIGTYRQPYEKRASDPLSRKHYDLLRKLKREGRVEHVERTGWRLTEAEWNRLN